MALAHAWIPMKFGVKTTTECKACRGVILPNINVKNIYTCKNCDYPIHQKCLLIAKGVTPCTNITLREVEELSACSGEATVFSSTKGLTIGKGLLRASSQMALSKLKKRWLTLTVTGILYISSSSDASKPISALLIQDCSKIELSKQTEIELEGENMTPFTLQFANAEEQKKWFNYLTERKTILTTPRRSAMNGLAGYIPTNDATSYNHLTIKVSEAKDLVAMDLCGTSDCYCILKCEHEYFRTPTIRKTLAPFWAETVEFGITDPSTATLTVYVMDEDYLQTDEPIGQVDIPLKTISATKTETWYPLKKVVAGIITGDILLAIVRKDNELYVKLRDGRNLASADPNGKSDPYVKLEVGTQKKKSKVIKKTLNPTFNEEFTFSLKKGESVLIVEVYDWDFLVGDDFLGMFTIDFSEFPVNTPIEKFYALEPKMMPDAIKAEQDKATADLGKIKLGCSLLRKYVHPIEIYKPLFCLLTRNYESVFLVGKHIKEKGIFSQHLLKVFDINGKCVHLARNLTDGEIANTPNPDIIFRGNTIVTKTLDSLMKVVGQNYLGILAPFFSEICYEKKNYEVDPSKADKKQDIAKNRKKLAKLCQAMLDKIFASVAECPDAMAIAFNNIRSKVESTYQADQIKVVKYTSISAFVFLRFFGPAIINPKLFGFVDKYPPTAARTCTLVAKVIQNLANLVFFGDKEPYMKEFNSFIEQNMENMKKYIDALCAKGAAQRNKSDETIFEGIWLEKELAMVGVHIDDCRNGWYDESNPLAVELAKEIDLLLNLDEEMESSS